MKGLWSQLRKVSALNVVVALGAALLAGCDGAALTAESDEKGSDATQNSSSNSYSDISSAGAYSNHSNNSAFYNSDSNSSDSYHSHDGYSSNDYGSSGNSSYSFGSFSSEPSSFSQNSYGSHSSYDAYSSYDSWASSSVDTMKDTPQTVFEQNCSACHDPDSDKALVAIDADRFNLSELTSYIEAEMSLLSPETCMGECAELTALYIKSWTNTLVKGEEIFQNQCVACHSNDAGSFSVQVQNYTIHELVSFIDTLMPASAPSACTGDCANDVAAFIKNQKAYGDAKRGQALYDSEKCSSCHEGNTDKLAISPLGDLSAWSHSELADYIEKNMPYSRPWLCVGSCAQDIAVFLSKDLANASKEGILALSAPLLRVEGSEIYSIINLDFDLADYLNPQNVTLSFDVVVDELAALEPLSVGLWCGVEPCGVYQFELEPEIARTTVTMRLAPYYDAQDLNLISHVRIGTSSPSHLPHQIENAIWRNDLNEMCQGAPELVTGHVASDSIILDMEETAGDIIVESFSSSSHSSSGVPVYGSIASEGAYSSEATRNDIEDTIKEQPNYEQLLPEHKISTICAYN